MSNMRAATYLRVSTRAQGDEDRLGLASQEAAIIRVCEERGYDITRRYSDIGYSGATADRPGLASLLDEAAKRAFDAVVVYRFDRLARNLMLDGYIRYQLRSASITVVSATENNTQADDPIAALTTNVLSAVAEFERHLISQRLYAARTLKRKRGGYDCGRPPFGRRANGKQLVVDDCEAPTIELMHQLRAAGRSYGSIALWLNGRGFLPRHAASWSRGTIYQILRRTRGTNMAE